MDNKNRKISLYGIIVGLSIGLVLFILLQMIGAALVRGEVISDEYVKLISYISVFMGCILSMFLICGNDRLSIWIGLNILIWCTVLWSIGMLVFKEPSSLMMFTPVFIVITVASVLGSIIKSAVGGRR